MSNEIRVQVSLQIKQTGGPEYQSRPTSFQADMAGVIGPTPGAVTVTQTGVNVDLSALAAPGGWCRIANYDTVHTVEWGAYDAGTPTRFIPVGELLPGESIVIRLSRYLGAEQTATGTGTASLSTGDKLRLRVLKEGGPAITAVCTVEAFDK